MIPQICLCRWQTARSLGGFIQVYYTPVSTKLTHLPYFIAWRLFHVCYDRGTKNEIEAKFVTIDTENILAKLICYNYPMDLTELIQQYLDGNKHMQLATVKDGRPWICTVYFASDTTFSLYWSSMRSSRHSREIVGDSHVAVTVVRDTERRQALQMTGDASEVSGQALEHAHNLYTKKFGPKDFDIEEMKKHTADGRSYWVFKPTSISLWDQVNFPNAPKQHYS
jgi:uncharacterized protein YhbP (UPF0306 family)